MPPLLCSPPAGEQAPVFLHGQQGPGGGLTQVSQPARLYHTVYVPSRASSLFIQRQLIALGDGSPACTSSVTADALAGAVTWLPALASVTPILLYCHLPPARADLQHNKLPFAHDLPPCKTLIEAVRTLKPTALIGMPSGVSEAQGWKTVVIGLQLPGSPAAAAGRVPISCIKMYTGTATQTCISSKANKGVLAPAWHPGSLPNHPATHTHT
jgi:hypothetical protein